VGGAPSSPPTSLITPEPKPDVANYLIRAGFERKISTRWFWNTGASWYRNDDAGLNRYIFFAGVGNTWADNQRRRFVTSYGISYTVFFLALCLLGPVGSARLLPRITQTWRGSVSAP
jgi:hypothetical protein